MSEEAPKRKRRPKKPPYPRGYQRQLAKVTARAAQREVANPGVKLVQDGPGQPYRFEPVFSGDDAFWWLQLADVFGTRSDSVIQLFLRQLRDLCGDYEPDERTLNGLIGIVAAAKPRNEQEAMLAAQQCATHITLMRLAGRANAYHGHVNESAAKVVARLASASAEQAIALGRIQGRVANQTITVVQRTEVHHVSTAFAPGGGDFFERPEAPRRAGGKFADAIPALEHEGRPALSGPHPIRRPLPRPSGERASALPLAWLWSWVRWAKGREERRVQERGLHLRGAGGAETGDEDPSGVA